jgi:hypothetical protein
MRTFILLLVFSLFAFTAEAQQFSLGVFGGASAYNGDLTTKIFPKKLTNGVIGITLNYELQDQITLRGGINYTIVGGADRFTGDTELIKRNLSFETRIIELNLLGEYYLFNLYDRRFSPYLFAGLAVFRFNPYAYTTTKQKVFLNPLGTEGQGLAGYPKSYSLTQLAIPFGGGIKFVVSDKFRVGLEFGLRKLFTDYLDDISTNYADEAELFAARGQLAVDMAYRGDEVATGNPAYPAKGAQRGSPKAKDYYYFLGLHLTYTLGLGGSGGIFRGGGNHKKYGCPANPL